MPLHWIKPCFQSIVKKQALQYIILPWEDAFFASEKIHTRVLVSPKKG